MYASDGTYLFDLEMQTVDKGDLPQRSRYYNCVLDIDQIYKEGDYVQLKPVFVIFICTFALSYGDRHRYTFCRYSTEDRNAALNDGTQIIMFSTKGTVDDLDEPMKQFLDCVDGKTAPGSGDAYIRQLDQSVKEARMNKEWRREYMNLEIMLKHAADEAQRELKIEEIYELFVKQWLSKKGNLSIVDLAETHLEGSSESETQENALCRAVVVWKGQQHAIGDKGNGPIDAFSNALAKIDVPRFTITAFHEHSIGTGNNTSAVAYIQITCENGNQYWGVGKSTNIGRAGIDAVVSAINQI